MITIKITCLECRECLKLETICHRIVKERQYQAEILKFEQDHFVQENDRLMAPVLMINERVYSHGRVPDRKEIEGWIDEILRDYFY